MILFVILQGVPPLLLLILAVCLYLVWADVKDEPGIEFQIKLWWVLLVLLFHVPGYLIFRLWIAMHRRRASGQA